MAAFSATRNANEIVCHPSGIEIYQNLTRVELDLEVICEQVERAIRLLSRFDLKVSSKVQINIVEEVRHNCGEQLAALFDVQQVKIEISSFEYCSNFLRNTEGLQNVPPIEWYGSLFAHELVHAAIAARQTSVDLEPVAHEYLAYALQLSFLSEQARLAILAAYPRKTPTDLDIFNPIYLALAPMKFAANAYRHFVSKADRKTFCRQILAGDISFPQWDGE